MSGLRDVLRAALAQTNGARAGRRREEPLFLQALIEALAPQLQAHAPVLQSVVKEAKAAARGDAILREQNDPRENL